MNEKLSFASDYEKGAHPNILARMVETNIWKSAGYGLDDISESARNRIRKACGKENAAVAFLVGGTQTNAVMIDALLKSYQGVIAAETGHISVHEAGAIEANGHKVLALPHHYGKLSAAAVEKYLDDYLKLAGHMDEQSIRNVLKSVFSAFEFKKYDDSCKILFMHGTKGNETVSKKAALKMKEVNPQTQIKCFDGYAHAQLLSFETKQWIKEVKDFLGK